MYSHFSWYFWRFFVFFYRFSACIACILTCSDHSVYDMDIQVYIMHNTYVCRYQEGICLHVQCVMRRCRAFFSCSVVRKSTSSRAQCVFYFRVFFIFCQPHAGPPSKRETKNKKRVPLPSTEALRFYVCVIQ